jgi:hypothetical protein
MAKFEEQLEKVEQKKSALNKLIPPKEEATSKEKPQAIEKEITDENEEILDEIEENLEENDEIGIPKEYLHAMGKTLVEGLGNYETKINRDRFDDINDRVTILLNKNLHEQLNALTTGNRGLKSELINIAVKMVLESGYAEMKANEYRKKKEQLAKLERQMKKLKR